MKVSFHAVTMREFGSFYWKEGNSFLTWGREIAFVQLEEGFWFFWLEAGRSCFNCAHKDRDGGFIFDCSTSCLRCWSFYFDDYQWILVGLWSSNWCWLAANQVLRIHSPHPLNVVGGGEPGQRASHAASRQRTLRRRHACIWQVD